MAGADGHAPRATEPQTPDGQAALAGFSPATRDWFVHRFSQPTPVQSGTWQTVASGAHALVVAPTGSGKTLAAFLHAIDHLAQEKTAAADAVPDSAGTPATRVLYVSPVKALAADIRRNLDAPLAGVDAEREARGEPRSGISVGMRTGDTPAAERAKLVRRPPDILVTTPESLFLMLTSRAAETLRGVRTVIVDEVHSVAGTKRGSHLALSLARLDALLPAPAQRIGLSATVSPVDAVASFLGGEAPVTMVRPPAQRVPDVRIAVPVEDLGDIAGGATDRSPDGTPVPSASARERTGSIWPHIEASILDDVLAHRSTLVFVNSRGLAEKLTARLNELHAERHGAQPAPVLHSANGSTVGRTSPPARGPELPLPDTVPSPRQPHPSAAPPDAAAGSEPGAPPEIIARAHHGSVSKEQRLLVENELKSGELRCVVATSSLELGIDMGEVDLVVQVAAPPDAASGLQRVGRANHQVGGTARGIVYPRTRRDLLEAAVIVERMEHGELEPLSPPANPLDVLAQHTVSALVREELTADEWYTVVRRSHPFRNLTRAAFESVLGMLAGRWSSEEFAGLRPQIVWDRETGALTARPGAQRLATTNAGTIPDRGAYSVMLPEGEEATGARRVGELDEEMVHESRVGDIITLGAGSWRVQEISTDRVTVVPAPGRSARLPFWHGEGPGRPAELGEAIGEFVREFERRESGEQESDVPEASGADRVQANLRAFFAEQRQATGYVPTDTDLLLEICPEETGDLRLVLHSPYGRRVHAPWALAIGERLRELGGDASVMAADDGIVARLPADGGWARITGTEHIPHPRSGATTGSEDLPVTPETLTFEPEALVHRVEQLVGGSALFAARFRECAARALLLPRRDPGRRTPLWQQRLRAGQLLEAVAEFPDFPILVETARECLQDVYDLPRLQELMRRIRSGGVRIHAVRTQVPSPFAGDLLFGYVGEFLYEGDRPLAERRASTLALDPALLADLVGRGEAAELLDPEIIAEVEAELQRVVPGRRARGSEGVADLLRSLGPLTAAEVAQRLEPEHAVPAESGTGPEAVPEQAVSAAPSAAPEPGADAEPDTEPGGDAGGRDRGAAEGSPTAAEDHRAAALSALRSLESSGRAIRLRATRHPDQDDLAAPSPTTDGSDAHVLWAAVEDTGRLRAVLGESIVPGDVPAEFLDPGADPAGELLRRFARTRGLFSAADAAGALQTGTATVQPVLDRLREAGTLIALPDGWVHADVFARIRRRALRAAREATRPVPAAAYARLLLERQHLLRPLHGADGLVRVVEQLSGLALPASLWESAVLPARVADYSPQLLDQLIGSGEIGWASASAPGSIRSSRPSAARRSARSPAAPTGTGPQDDGAGPQDPTAEPPDPGTERDPLVSLHLTELREETLPAEEDDGLTALEEAVVAALSSGGAWTAGEIAARVDAAGAGSTRTESAPPGALHADAAGVSSAGLRAALWSLTRRGLVTSDSFSPVRAAYEVPAAGAASRRAAASARRSGRAAASRRGHGRGLRGSPLGASYSSSYRSLPPAADRTALASAPGPDPHHGTPGWPQPDGSPLPATDPLLRGRWTLTRTDPVDPTERALGFAESLLDRHGVVTRAAAEAEKVPGGFPVLQRVFAGLEDAGHTVRGRFVTGMGGAQFAEHTTVDRLRELAECGSPGPVALSAADPANPFGRALPWPASAPGPHAQSAPIRPARAAGALLVIDDGRLVAWLSRGGKSMLTFPEAGTVLGAAASPGPESSSGPAEAESPPEYAHPERAAAVLVDAAHRARMAGFTLETIDGRSALSHPWASALKEAGLSVTPRGLRFYG
jgi:ATP-dependent Lhr-like helicase